jgi:hypothetical protein
MLVTRLSTRKLRRHSLRRTYAFDLAGDDPERVLIDHNNKDPVV